MNARLTAPAVAALAAFASGCGSHSRPPMRLADWLTLNHAPKTATITLIPGYNGRYGGFNLNGYAKGEVDVVVPVGWAVTVRCLNTGSQGRTSCSVTKGAGAVAPAVSGASTPNPQLGLAHGRSAHFTFRATKPGVYRITSLVPGQEQSGMWDVLEISHTRSPHVILLRRPIG